MISSLHAYLSYNQHTIILCGCQVVIEYLSLDNFAICMPITCSSMAFFIIHVFPTVMGGTTHFFTQKRFSKEVLKRLKKFEILLLIQIIIRKIQGVNMLIISNRPRAMHSTNFEITYLITP